MPEGKSLTPRQLDVLRLAALQNDEIARHLGISPHTVKNHFGDIATRLLGEHDPRRGYAKRTLLLALALKWGLISLDEVGTDLPEVDKCQSA